MTSGAVATPTTSTTPPAPPVARTPLVGVHGTLVDVTPAGRSISVLGFQPDGSAEVYEVESGLTAGAVGDTLVVSGSVGPNDLGLSAQPRAVQVSLSALDDVRVVVRLDMVPLVPSEPVFLRGPGIGESYDPTGPLAPALTDPARIRNSGLNSDYHYVVTGRRGPPSTTVGARQGTDTLEVTSWRFALRLEVTTGETGSTTANRGRFVVDDLVSEGRYRLDASTPTVPGPTLLVRNLVTAEAGGRLDDARRADLQRLLLAADLRSYPNGTRFPPTATPGARATGITIGDDRRRHGITIEDGAVLPAPLAGLLARIQSTRDGAPGTATLAQGDDSAVTTRQTRVIRTAAAWSSIWAQHRGPNSTTPAPTVDFQTQLVIALFAGEGPTPANDPIRVLSSTVEGQDLRVTTTSGGTRPGEPVTTHYQFQVVNLRGLTGDLYLDGVRR